MEIVFNTHSGGAFNEDAPWIRVEADHDSMTIVQSADGMQKTISIAGPGNMQDFVTSCMQCLAAAGYRPAKLEMEELGWTRSTN